MKQAAFENRFSQEWQDFAGILKGLESSARLKKKTNSQEQATFAKRYRRLCHYLSMAKERGYSQFLTNYLNELVIRGHAQLYHHKPTGLLKIIRFFLYDFPVLIRSELKFVIAAGLLFFLPLLIACGIVYLFPDSIYVMFDPGKVTSFETMYESSSSIRASRNADDNFVMFGYYIFNNISIGFRCFAGGILFGLGSVFFLIFNGIMIGAVAGHMIDPRFVSTFYSFVIGHGAFELTAIVFSGAAGLKLGVSLVSPGRMRRVNSLKQAAKVSIRLVYGVIAMLVIAAFLEAFWSSSSSLPSVVKFAVGGGFWIMVIVYFLGLGRIDGSQ